MAEKDFFVFGFINLKSLHRIVNTCRNLEIVIIFAHSVCRIKVLRPSTELQKPNGVSQFITNVITYKPDSKSGDLVVLMNHRKVCVLIAMIDTIVKSEEISCSLFVGDCNSYRGNILITDYFTFGNKKPFNLYKKTICSYLNTESNCYLYINQVITKVLQYLDDEAVVQTDKINLKRIIFIFNTNGIIVFDSNGIFIFETDHEIRDRSDITTIYGGLGPSIVIIAITPESIANRNRSDIRSTGSFDQPCIYTVTDTLKSGDVVIPMGLDNSSLISVNSDRSHKRVAQNISIIELQYTTRTDEGPDHFRSSNRNFNEVNNACQHSIDDKSRVLFDEPIVWPATQLVPTMDQMLAGPGTK